LRVIGREISQALTARAVAACAEREARQALAARNCYVYELVEDDLVLAHHDHDPAEPWSPIPLSASTPVSDCVRSGTSLHCRTRSEILERYPWMQDHIAVDDQAWAAVPLTIERRRIGALFLSFAEARNWTPDELDLTATIADQCAQALARIALQAEIDSFRSAQAEHRFQSALDAMFDLVTVESAVRDAAGRIVDFRIDYMNQADIDVAGRAAQDLTGHMLSETYPAAFDDGLFEGYVRVVETGKTLVINDLPYADTIDGAAVSGHYGVRIAKFGDGIIISARVGRLDNTDPA
jgi:PAS domain-containing protein